MPTATLAHAEAVATVLAQHPLEPLSAAEITAAVALIRADDRFGPRTRFVVVTLREPEKAAILNDQSGAASRLRSLRSGRAVASSGGRSLCPGNPCFLLPRLPSDL